MERLHNTSAVKLLPETATGFKWEPTTSRADSGWLQRAAFHKFTYPTKATLWIGVKHTLGRRQKKGPIRKVHKGRVSIKGSRFDNTQCKICSAFTPSEPWWWLQSSFVNAEITNKSRTHTLPAINLPSPCRLSLWFITSISAYLSSDSFITHSALLNTQVI